MLRRVLVWRTVTTERDAALLARAKMHPACSDLHTLCTNSLFRLLNVSNRIDMIAYLYCHAASIQALADNRRGEPGSDNPSLCSMAHPFLSVVHHDCPQHE